MQDATEGRMWDPEDRYMDLEALAAYSSLSVRRLRSFVRSPIRPLPHFRPGGSEGKILVKRSEFDLWMERQPQRAKVDEDLNKIVDEVVSAVIR